MPDATIKSIIKHGGILDGCDRCLHDLVQPNELAAGNRRNYQQREYARDITQPFEKGYVKARGIEAAREKGWSDAAIRKYS